MIRKSKYSVIKALVKTAKKLGVRLDKSDVRVGYTIECYNIFIWNCQEEFENFMEKSVRRLQKRGSGQVKGFYRKREAS